MTEIRTAIAQILKDLHPRVYFQLAPEEALMPYLVFDLPSINDDGEGFQNILLDVDGWDIPPDGDTTPLDILMEAVNENLNKKIVTTNNMAVIFYLDRKIPLQDDNKDIKRRKYIYEAKLFGRS